MPSGFEAGSGDDVHAGILKCSSLVGCCHRADRYDAFRPALLQNFARRNPKDEAERRHFGVQQNAHLIFEPHRRIRLVSRTRRSQLREMRGQRCEAPVERAFIRSSRVPVFHRHPQIHRERFRGERANLCDHVFDRRRRQRERAKRSKSTKVGNGRCQSLRSKPAERTLNDGVLNPQLVSEPVPIPRGRRHADTSKINSSSTGTPSGRLATPYTRRHGFLSFPKTSCSNSEAPSAIFACSRTSPTVATDTPSRTIRVTLSSDPKYSRATARALSAARRAALNPVCTSSSAPTRPINLAERPSVGIIPVRKSRLPVCTASV